MHYMARLVVVLSLGVSVLLSPVAHAAYVYTYTGNPYTYANAAYGYSTSDYITATLDFTNPLVGTGCYAWASGTTGCTYDPLISASISDQKYTYTSASSGFFAILQTVNGEITNWEVGINSYPGVLTLTSLTGLSFGNVRDNATEDISNSALEEIGYEDYTSYTTGDNLNSPGEWTSPVPLPGTTVLLLSGIGALGLFRRKRLTA
jgi:hypothetical protein